MIFLEKRDCKMVFVSLAMFFLAGCGITPLTKQASNIKEYGWYVEEKSKSEFVVRYTGKQGLSMPDFAELRRMGFYTAAQKAIEKSRPFFMVSGETHDIRPNPFFFILLFTQPAQKMRSEFHVSCFESPPPQPANYFIDARRFVEKFFNGKWTNNPAEPYSFGEEDRIRLYEGPIRDCQNTSIIVTDGKVIVASVDSKILPGRGTLGSLGYDEATFKAAEAHRIEVLPGKHALLCLYYEYTGAGGFHASVDPAIFPLVTVGGRVYELLAHWKPDNSLRLFSSPDHRWSVEVKESQLHCDEP